MIERDLLAESQAKVDSSNLPPSLLRLSRTLKFAMELQRIQTPRRQVGSKNYK